MKLKNNFFTSSDFNLDNLFNKYYICNIIIGFCRWVIIFAHIYCYKVNNSSLLLLAELSGVSFSTPLAHFLNIIIPLYVFMLGSQSYYIATSQIKSLNIKSRLFTKMALPGIFYLFVYLILNIKDFVNFFSNIPTSKMSFLNILISKLRLGFISLELFLYAIILIFSPFVQICIPNYNSVMEYKKVLSKNNLNLYPEMENGLLQNYNIVDKEIEDIKLLNFGAISTIKCVVTSILLVYTLNVLKANDSNIFKLFTFLCIIILTISISSFAFKQHLFETYIFLISICIFWSSITLHGIILLKSEILDLMCSTLGVYLTIFAAGLFFSCIGIEIFSSKIYFILFVPIFVLSYNFNRYYITISPIFYPFYQCNSTIQKSLIISWLSIIPFITFSIKISFYLNKKKKLSWFIVQLPDLIIMYIIPFTPLFEYFMELNIHPII